MSNPLKFDISSFKSGLSTIPWIEMEKHVSLSLRGRITTGSRWNGGHSILSIRVKKQLKHIENVSIPGERFERVEFDLKTTIN